jgi:hypothetical protein
LTNTNGNANSIFSSVDCGEFYPHNFPSLYLLVNTNENISSVYAERIVVGKEEIKKPEKYDDM